LDLVSAFLSTNEAFGEKRGDIGNPARAGDLTLSSVLSRSVFIANGRGDK
jgi:hypothetical protein